MSVTLQKQKKSPFDQVISVFNRVLTTILLREIESSCWINLPQETSGNLCLFLQIRKEKNCNRNQNNKTWFKSIWDQIMKRKTRKTGSNLFWMQVEILRHWQVLKTQITDENDLKSLHFCVFCVWPKLCLRIWPLRLWVQLTYKNIHCSRGSYLKQYGQWPQNKPKVLNLHCCMQFGVRLEKVKGHGTLTADDL